MRPRRGHLFWGITLVLLGGVPLVVRAGLIPAESLSEAWRLWPVALIAAGVVLILFRRADATLAVVVGALAIGLIGGTALAGGSTIFNFFDCGNENGPAAARTLNEEGTFNAPARVDLDLNCGRLALTTADGDGWSLDAAFDGQEPRVDASGDSLEVEARGGPLNRRQTWNVALPADGVAELNIDTNAGASVIDLGSGAMGTLDVEANAGSIVVRAAEADLGGLSASVNAGSISVTLGSQALTGDLSANAGSVELCVPDEVNLRIVMQDNNITFSHNLDDRGLSRDGDVWTRAGSGETVTLQVEGNASSFDLDPEEGCE